MTLVKIAELFFLKNFFFKVFDNFRELKILEEKKLDLAIFLTRVCIKNRKIFEFLVLFDF